MIAIIQNKILQKTPIMTLSLLGGFVFSVIAHGQVATQVKLPVTFTIESKVEVTTDRIKLADISKCTGAKLICEEVYAVSLGVAPPPGMIEYLTKREIHKILAKEWPNAEIKIESSEAIAVSSKASKLTKAYVMDALVRFINNNFTDEDGLRLNVNRVQVTSNPIVRAGMYSISFPGLEKIVREAAVDTIAKELSGQQNIEVVYGSDKENYQKRFTASVNISVSRLLPVVSNNVVKGRILSSRDLSQGWVEFGRGNQKYITSSQDIIGLEAKRNIAAGEPLLSSHVARAMVVKRGQLVKLHMYKNGVVITGQLKALEKGGRGQFITAEYLNTKKKIRVKIRDSKNVEYKF